MTDSIGVAVIGAGMAGRRHVLDLPCRAWPSEQFWGSRSSAPRPQPASTCRPGVRCPAPGQPDRRHSRRQHRGADSWRPDVVHIPARRPRGHAADWRGVPDRCRRLGSNAVLIDEVYRRAGLPPRGQGRRLLRRARLTRLTARHGTVHPTPGQRQPVPAPPLGTGERRCRHVVRRNDVDVRWPGGAGTEYGLVRLHDHVAGLTHVLPEIVMEHG
jgi:hypothetical protein